MEAKMEKIDVNIVKFEVKVAISSLSCFDKKESSLNISCAKDNSIIYFDGLCIKTSIIVDWLPKDVNIESISFLLLF